MCVNLMKTLNRLLEKAPMNTGEKCENHREQGRGKIWHTRVYAFLLVVMVCLLGGCAPEKTEEEETEPVSVRIVYSGGDVKWKSVIEDVSESYMKHHPNVRLELYTMPEVKNRNYQENLRVMAAQEELYDVVELRETEQLVQAGLLAPIPEAVAGLVNRADVIDGEVYGIPRYTTTFGIIYNRNIFERLGLTEPENYEEFLEICCKIKASGSQPVTLGGADLWHMKFWASYLVQNHIGENDWTIEAAASMLGDFKGLIENGYIDPGCRFLADSQTAQEISSGHAAMLLSGPWMLPQIEALNPDIRLGFFFLPGRDGTVYAMEDSKVAWGISAATKKDASKMEAAESFLAWFYSEGVYENVLEMMNGEPVTVRQVDLAEFTHRKMIQKAYDGSTVSARMRLDDPSMPEGFDVEIEQSLIEILKGNGDIQRLAERLLKKLEVGNG